MADLNEVHPDVYQCMNEIAEIAKMSASDCIVPELTLVALGTSSIMAKSLGVPPARDAEDVRVLTKAWTAADANEIDATAMVIPKNDAEPNRRRSRRRILRLRRSLNLQVSIQDRRRVRSRRIDWFIRYLSRSVQ